MGEQQRNLVITRAGSESLHRTWISNNALTKPNFDVIVAAYHNDAIDTDNMYIKHLDIRGKKVEGWSKLFRDNPHLFDQYDQIALMDDDLEATTETINLCFSLGTEYNLAIWQPALSPDSYVTYAASIANPFFLIRFVNYIEMMCPFFKSKELKSIIPLFDIGLESGIDLVWCSIAHQHGEQCAIIDKAIIRHTRPVGIKKETNGFVGRDYESDIYKCLSLFSMRWPSWVSLRAITVKRSVVASKILLAFAAAFPFFTIGTAPSGTRLARLKISADHLRHQIFRPAFFANGIEDTIKQMYKLKTAIQQNNRAEKTI